MADELFIGTSGWQYDEWKDDFYEGVPKKDWLQYCAGHFNSLEVNATHYRMQSEKTQQHWLESTPDKFVFSIKGHRYITHSQQLRDAGESIDRARTNYRPLAAKLGVVLWQLPPQLKIHLDRLDDFTRELTDRWPEVRHAIEFRHRSWFDGEVEQQLAKRDVAVCQSDAADWPIWEAVTTDLVYLRFHGHTRTYASRYSRRLLADWAQRIQGWLGENRQVYAYFDNDIEGAAPYDALRLAQLCE